MENWTLEYDSNLDSQILTPDRVMLADIIVLQTPILPYNDYEINILKEFVDSGGSILILGTKSQYLSLNSLNKLLETLDSNISINNDNLIDYEDFGIGIKLEEKYISGSDLNINLTIFDTDDSFKFLFGPSLNILDNYNTYKLAKADDRTIVAAKFGENEGKGNIVVWSDYQWMLNAPYNDNSHGETHKDILINLFEFLNVKNHQGLSIQANFNTTVTRSSLISMDISISNSSTMQPIIDLTPGISINATITYPDNTLHDLMLNSSINNGIYFNSSVQLDYSDYRPYQIKISLIKNLKTFEKTYDIFRMSSSDEVVISEAVIEKIEMNRTDGNSNLIEYYTPVNYSSLNLILYGSLAPTNIFNSKSSKIFTIPLSKSSPNNFQGDIIIDGNDNSGYFIFYSLGNISTPDMHFFNIKSSRSYFRVINNAPIIIEESSLINGIKFEETNDNDSYYINEVSTNFPVTILLKTEEIVNYEDQIEDLSAIMIYLTVATSENTSTLIFPNLIPKCDLDFHEQGEYFGCDFTIPNSLEYNGTAGTLEISQQSSPDFIYLSLLLLTIRDSEGASSDYIFLLYVNVNPTINNMLDYIPIIILFIVIISIIWIVYIRSKPKHVENDEYYRDDWESYENSM